MVVELPAQLVFNLFIQRADFRFPETFHQHNGILGDVLIDEPAVFGLLVVWNGIDHPRFGIDAFRNVGKETFQAGFHCRWVNVAEDNDRLLVRTIEIVVISTHFIGREMVQHFRRSDNVMRGIFAVVVEIGVQLALHALREVHSLAPLFEDDLALDFHFIGTELQESRPVVKYEQAGVYQSPVCRRDAVDVVDRLIGSRVGIQIPDAPPLQKGGHALRKILRGMKSHVLQHVGKPVLMVFFHQGTHILHQVKVGFPGGCPRGTDVISQTVV